jgi:hypothetical protein
MSTSTAYAGNAGSDHDASELQIKGQAYAGDRGAYDVSKPRKNEFAAAQDLFRTGHRHDVDLGVQLLKMKKSFIRRLRNIQG